ncbi:MAG: DNA polymerase Y family protein, partial [Pseudomonadota bacterium]
MRKPGQSRSLFPTLPFEQDPQKSRGTAHHRAANAPTAGLTPGRDASRERLWLAIECVDLPLLARGGEPADGAPRAVVDETHGALTVCAASASARDQGVHDGLPLSAAYALIPDLQTCERDVQKEARWLERLAAWSLQFTSQVSPVPPDALLLEVRGSLTLFGGLDTLVQQVRGGLQSVGVTHRLAVAPTPLAALWSARGPEPALLTDPARLPDLVSRLPLSVTGWPLRIRQRLAGMGLSRVGDVLRLPRDGFARRFGRERRDDLDRVLGQRADPRTPITPEPRFDAQRDLPAETERLDLIEHALGELLGELAGVLHAHQRGVAAFRLLLKHLDAPVTSIEVGLA